MKRHKHLTRLLVLFLILNATVLPSYAQNIGRDTSYLPVITQAASLGASGDESIETESVLSSEIRQSANASDLDGTGAYAQDGIPISGTSVRSLEAFDRAMVDFMRALNIEAGTLAVSRHGVILLRRGYGWQDRAHQEVVDPDALMRLASIDKVLTSVAIKRLIQEGELSAETRVFPLLSVGVPPGQTPDPRLNDITIQHLLSHRGGWDQKSTHFDPYFQTVYIASELGIPSPARTPDIAYYMAGQPLQFTPGEREVYSNFGYSLLRWIVEIESGQELTKFFQTEFGLDVDRSYAFPQDRNPREIWYSSTEMSQNVYSPSEVVHCPDGGFLVESRTLAGTSTTLADFLTQFWISGEERAPGDVGYIYLFYGGLCGTFTFVYQHPNGVNVAALFNKDSSSAREEFENIVDIMAGVIEGTSIGPELLLSSSTNGSVSGISFANEDILAHNPMSDSWRMFFDGSDVGIRGNVDALAFLGDGSILLSLDAPAKLPDVGWVDDSDIVRFIPRRLGAITRGRFIWYFDGSDVGLTNDGEDVDSIAIGADGRLLISTIGQVRVPGVQAVDEDVLIFTPSRLGATTAGRWNVLFDGSDIGLRETSEDVRGVWYDVNGGNLYLSTIGDLRVSNLQGSGADIVKFHIQSSGLTTRGLFMPFWRGKDHEFGDEKIDAFTVLVEPWADVASAASEVDEEEFPEYLGSEMDNEVARGEDDVPDDLDDVTLEFAPYRVMLPFVLPE